MSVGNRLGLASSGTISRDWLNKSPIRVVPMPEALTLEAWRRGGLTEDIWDMRLHRGGLPASSLRPTSCCP